MPAGGLAPTHGQQKSGDTARQAEHAEGVKGGPGGLLGGCRGLSERPPAQHQGRYDPKQIHRAPAKAADQEATDEGTQGKADRRTHLKNTKDATPGGWRDRQRGQRRGRGKNKGHGDALNNPGSEQQGKGGRQAA